MSELAKIASDNLRKILANKKMTQEELANILSVDPRTVRRYLKNGIDKLSTLELIAERLGVDGVYEKGSCADFYIDDTYLTVVGNKASGIIGFTGYICEIYNVESKKLLAYEVQETLSVINYDTLWFNLDDVEGINNIKVVEGNTADNKNNPYTIYINNSNTPFKVKNGSIIDPSRRYDIELRRQ